MGGLIAFGLPNILLCFAFHGPSIVILHLCVVKYCVSRVASKRQCIIASPVLLYATLFASFISGLNARLFVIQKPYPVPFGLSFRFILVRNCVFAPSRVFKIVSIAAGVFSFHCLSFAKASQFTSMSNS